MEHFCRVIMLGRATGDPVRRPGRGRSVVVTFGFVFNDRYKDGEKWLDKPMFMDCEAFGDLAEAIFASVRKGWLVLVEGKLRLDEWQDRNTKETRRKHKLILTACKTIDRPKTKQEKPAEEPESPGDALFGGAAQKSEPEEPEPI